MRAITFAAVCAGAAVIAFGAHAHDGDMQHAASGQAPTQGRPGNPKKVSRTIEVLMSDDMRFTPAKIDVKRGQTVRFVLKNAGRLTHEMVIGSKAELQEHAEMMRSMPGMEHEEPNEVTVEPGKTGVMVWQFTRGGSVGFACLQPGHYEAGMKGEVVVK